MLKRGAIVLKKLRVDAYQAAYRENHRQERRDKENLRRKAKPEQIRLAKRLEGLRLRTEVLTHYGKGKCACVICGFDDDIRALSIDHLNGGGTQHRRSLSGTSGFGGKDFCRWLKRNGYPKGYQTLCMNCQFIKR